MRLSALFILVLVLIAIGVGVYNSQAEPAHIYRPFDYIPEAMQRLAGKGSFAFEVESSIFSSETNAPLIRFNGWWSKTHGFYVEERQGSLYHNLTGVYMITPDGRVAVMTNGTWTLGSTPLTHVVDITERQPVAGGTWKWVDDRTAQKKMKYLRDFFLGPYDDIRDRIGYGLQYSDTYEIEGDRVHYIYVNPPSGEKIDFLNDGRPLSMYQYRFHIGHKSKLPTWVSIDYSHDTGKDRFRYAIHIRYFNIGKRFDYPVVPRGK